MFQHLGGARFHSNWETLGTIKLNKSFLLHILNRERDSFIGIDITVSYEEYDQMVILFVHYLPDSIKICQSRFKILPNKPSQTIVEYFKNSRSGYILPNLITLAMTSMPEIKHQNWFQSTNKFVIYECIRHIIWWRNINFRSIKAWKFSALRLWWDGW